MVTGDELIFKRLWVQIPAQEIDFTRKMIDFDTLRKITLEFERFGQINCCQRL